MNWRVTKSPVVLPSPIPVRGIPNLSASDDPRFPETIPHIGDDLLRVELIPQTQSIDAFAQAARNVIDHSMIEHPAILFQGLPIRSRKDFSNFFNATGLLPHDYKGGNAIRDKSSDNVSVTSIENPAIVISPHNENVYMPEPPDFIMFCCVEPAATGGELPDKIVEEMKSRDLRYIRRLVRDDNEYDIGWRTAFATQDKAEIEAYLKSQNIPYRWKDDEVMEFWFNTPVFKSYQGEELWFNQLSECNAQYWLLNPDSEKFGYTLDTVQSDTAYGDGEPFPWDVPIMVRAAIWQTTEYLRMEPGDIIVLNNNIMQHGRMAYTGNRQHYAALARIS